MKKLFVFLILGLFLTSCDFLLSRPSDGYVKEQIAQILELPVDQIVVDFENMETVDMYVLEKLQMQVSDSKVASRVKEKVTGKSFIVIYDGVKCESVTLEQ